MCVRVAITLCTSCARPLDTLNTHRHTHTLVAARFNDAAVNEWSITHCSLMYVYVYVCSDAFHKRNVSSLAPHSTTLITVKAHSHRHATHDTTVLPVSRQAKRRRRRLERRYHRSGLQSDKQAYNAACKASRDSITTSRADHIKTQLEQASGDIRATWRTAQTLLHSRQKVVHDDA